MLGITARAQHVAHFFRVRDSVVDQLLLYRACARIQDDRMPCLVVFLVLAAFHAFEQRIAEASEFQRRQRERAAQVLTAGQLEVFTQRQQDMLEMARGSWEYEEQANNKGSN